MQSKFLISMVGMAAFASPVLAQDAPASSQLLNPMIELLEQGKPTFGLYAPSNRRYGQPPPEYPKTNTQLAAQILSYPYSDYIFDGSMEHDYPKGLEYFTDFQHQLSALAPSDGKRLKYPTAVKMHAIGEDYATAAAHIGDQLNMGVSSIVLVEVENAEQVRQAIKAMRLKEQGGTRADAVGIAPSRWGLSEADYRQKADVWPLNPQGELVVIAIVETKEGLANVREIAAVEGLSVLFPGAGSLRGVFSTTNAKGERVVDQQAWENANQQVLSACKEFKVTCGYPANENDIETRMQQGFNSFIIGWGDAGFRAVDIGRRVGNR